jgi:hypothetical protein
MTIGPFLAHNKAKFDPDAIPSRKRVLSRQVKLLQNLLRWRKYVGELYGIGELCSKLVGDVIVPIAQTGWEVGGEDAVRKVSVDIYGYLPNLLPWCLCSVSYAEYVYYFSHRYKGSLPKKSYRLG